MVIKNISSFIKSPLFSLFFGIFVSLSLWILCDKLVFTKINVVKISNLEISEINDLAFDQYKSLEEQAPILNKDMNFSIKDIDDIIKVLNGESLKISMIRFGFSNEEIQKIINLIPKHFNKIIPGQDIFINYDYLGKYIEKKRKNEEDKVLFPNDYALEERFFLNEMDIRLNKSEEQVRIKKDSSGNLVAEFSKLSSAKKTSKVKAKIGHSLFLDGLQRRVPISVINKMIQEFSYDVDFQRDIQRGDEFTVLFEEYYDDKNRKVKDGKLIYAALQVQKKWHKMYLYNGNFYNEKGQEVKKTMLKTPIDGARISSGFGMRRHPILGYTRAHKGVDFAAPIGTPIYAAGDGIVTKAGRGNGYGNLVSIKHTKEYETNYAHMKAFAKGIKAGIKVKQRQIIGYVGMTGLTSGPHLHFELVKNGEKVNPTKHTFKSGIELSGKTLLAYKEYIKSIDKEIS